jgi:hypothetical protein
MEDFFTITFPIIGLGVLLFDLRKQFSIESKNAFVLELLIILSSIIIHYLVTSNEPMGIIVTPERIPVLFFLTFGICFVAIVKNNSKSFYSPKKWKKIYSTLFGASMLWFSSIVPDLIDLMRHFYENIPMADRVMGGAGLNDGLFLYGSTAFVILAVFYLLWMVILWSLNTFGFSEFSQKSRNNLIS